MDWRPHLLRQLFYTWPRVGRELFDEVVGRVGIAYHEEVGDADHLLDACSFYSIGVVVVVVVAAVVVAVVPLQTAWPILAEFYVGRL